MRNISSLEVKTENSLASVGPLTDEEKRLIDSLDLEISVSSYFSEFGIELSTLIATADKITNTHGQGSALYTTRYMSQKVPKALVDIVKKRVKINVEEGLNNYLKHYHNPTRKRNLRDHLLKIGIYIKDFIAFMGGEIVIRESEEDALRRYYATVYSLTRKNREDYLSTADAVLLWYLESSYKQVP